MKRIVCLMIATVSGAAFAEPPAPPGFCRRLADGMGMRQVKMLGPGSLEVETKGLGAKLLFGGGYSFSLGVRPVEGQAGAPDGNKCDVAKKGAVCTIVGPAVLRLMVKGNAVSTEAAPGETADVRIVGSRIRCDGR